MAEQEAKISFGLGNMIGWLFGALSFLNLINDMDLIEIQGKIAVWLYAYDYFVQTIGNFLFGWINFYWFKASISETHFFIIMSTIGLSIIRSTAETSYMLKRDKDIIDHIMTFLFSMMLHISIISFIIIFVEPFSYIVTIIAFLIFVLAVLDCESNIFYAVFAKNIMVVSGIVLIFIAINYMMFPNAIDI